MRRLDEVHTTTNPRLHRRLYRQHVAKCNALCNYCPPHGGENRGRSMKYPIKKEFQLIRLGRKVERYAKKASR